MAASQENLSSSYSTNLLVKIENKNDKLDELSPKDHSLVICGHQLTWKGNVDQLKQFTCDILKLAGKWKSPGGDVKIFSSSSEELVFKWHGIKRKKIEVVKDCDNKLLNSLKIHAQEKTEANDDKIIEESVDHVRGDMSLPLDEKHVSYSDLEAKLELVLARLNKLEESSKNEIIVNTVLVTKNDLMAAEIQSLKSTVTMLKEENENIKKLLDIKQDEWIQVESRQSTRIPCTIPIATTPVENRFATLGDEDPVAERNSLPVEADSITIQIDDYRNEQKQKFHKVKKPEGKQRKPKQPKQPTNTIGINQQTPRHPKQPENTIKKTLVIGDSMVKHIDDKKIERAARGKSVCHSYSGATVSQLTQKFKENCQDDQYDTIIIHVGTNDLVREDADKVATNMEKLIEEVKHRAERVAVSSVIERYDGRVPSSKIEYYNNLISNLCLEQNIYYINNNDINKSLLNNSNLHLNNVGDRALGGAFCTFLKSTRASYARPIQARSDQAFFQLAGHRNKEWTNYLKYVSQVLRK